jgi:ribosomal 50S subunit-recycling heat shock protein
MEALRLDVWLDIACLFRTRSEAQKACKIGRVDVNGQPAKPHREIRPGDEIVISRPMGRKQTVVVRGLADRHIPRAEARELYDDRTPRLDLIRIGGQVNWRGVRVSFFFLIHQDDGCGRSWETAFCAVFQIPVGAFLASTGMAASMPYAAASRSNLAGLI